MRAVTSALRPVVQLRVVFKTWIVVLINNRYHPVYRRDGNLLTVYDPKYITIVTYDGNDDVHIPWLLGMGRQFVGTRTYLGNGHDTMTGSNYDDYVHCGAGSDIVTLGHGNDTCYGGSGDDRIGLGVGVDFVDGGTGWDTAWGTRGDRYINPCRRGSPRRSL